jgi:hypothetical protein
MKSLLGTGGAGLWARHRAACGHHDFGVHGTPYGFLKRNLPPSDTLNSEFCATAIAFISANHFFDS